LIRYVMGYDHVFVDIALSHSRYLPSHGIGIYPVIPLCTTN
jgi:hypothetical protein